MPGSRKNSGLACGSAPLWAVLSLSMVEAQDAMANATTAQASLIEAPTPHFPFRMRSRVPLSLMRRKRLGGVNSIVIVLRRIA